MAGSAGGGGGGGGGGGFGPAPGGFGAAASGAISKAVTTRALRSSQGLMALRLLDVYGGFTVPGPVPTRAAVREILSGSAVNIVVTRRHGFDIHGEVRRNHVVSGPADHEVVAEVHRVDARASVGAIAPDVPIVARAARRRPPPPLMTSSPPRRTSSPVCPTRWSPFTTDMGQPSSPGPPSTASSPPINVSEPRPPDIMSPLI